MKKKIKVQEVFDYLNAFAPMDLAETWDSVGLQTGDLNKEVQGILISLDPTEAVLWEAAEKGANTLITHHPLLLKPLKVLDNSSIASRLARLSVLLDLNILSFHTNLDATRGGLNDVLAQKIGLKQTQAMIPNPKNPKVGLGRLGKVPTQSLESLIKKLQKSLKLKNLRYTGDLKQKIHDVGVMTGSGGAYFKEAKEAGAQVLITGDVKYHHALDAQQENIALIDIGHFHGEFPMIKLLADLLKKWAKQKKLKLKIEESLSQQDPFHFFS
ncbi:MAG: Nif3-like dinuclear metal center hexameric protein [Deltaproteobacteria bacterium]|nr:Nif3-like dinuclear metal center hexameric protein [Deltaproteobacteria bacterium]